MRILILGGGFAGLACARRLGPAQVEVTVVDRNNYHLFTPLLYQVAGSLLDPSDIAQPIRKLLSSRPNVRFVLAEAVGADFQAKVLKTTAGDLPYDRLVVAVGSATNYFGIPGLEGATLGLKDLPESLQLRNHILRCLETASRLPGAERRPWLTFVVAGGGPTGVEYAGALSELVRLVLPGEYPDLAGETVRIVLVEALPRVLAAFAPPLSREAGEELQRKGIELKLGVAVQEASPEKVTLSDGSTIPTRTIVWTAGVKASPAIAALGLPATPRGRIDVDEHLRVRGLDGVYAVGDAAGAIHNGRELPMMAPPAMQEGRYVADSIRAELEGGRPHPFRFMDKGVMATIGRNAAVAQVDRLQLKGFVGWVAWLALHLYYLIGFRNRLSVLMRWAHSYVFYDRPVRLILQAKRERDN